MIKSVVAEERIFDIPVKAIYCYVSNDIVSYTVIGGGEVYVFNLLEEALKEYRKIKTYIPTGNGR